VSVSAQNTPLLYLRGSFHGAREIRDGLSLGDVDARRLSWSDFS
jgi:cob(II)yrinic acid a,c-diamide reductase